MKLYDSGTIINDNLLLEGDIEVLVAQVDDDDVDHDEEDDENQNMQNV